MQPKKRTNEEQLIEIKQLPTATLTLKLIGTPGVPLVVHQLATKHNVAEMLDRQLGKKVSRKGKIGDPFAEYMAARYLDADGDDCVPTHAIKLAICSALQFLDVNLAQAKARRIIHVNPGQALTKIAHKTTAHTVTFSGLSGDVSYQIEDNWPEMRMDVVRLGGIAHAPDIRFRPAFVDWSVVANIEFPSTMITPNSIVNLAAMAGKFIGVCENRPEKGGEWGTFSVEAG